MALLAMVESCDDGQAEGEPEPSEFVEIEGAPVGDNLVGLIRCRPPRNPHLLSVRLNIRPEATEVVYRFRAPVDAAAVEVLRANIQLDLVRFVFRLRFEGGEVVESSVEQNGEALGQELKDVAIAGSEAQFFFGPPATETIAVSRSLKFSGGVRLNGEDINCQ